MLRGAPPPLIEPYVIVAHHTPPLQKKIMGNPGKYEILVSPQFFHEHVYI